MKNEISIKKFNKDDLEELLVNIIKYEKSNGKSVTNDLELSTKNELIELLSNKNALTYVAKQNDIIVGYINAHIINFPLIMGKECYISGLLVNDKQRGLGIGHLLIKKIEEITTNIGCKRLILNNPKRFESYKRKFYSKVGFEERVDVGNFVKQLNR